MNPLNLVVPFWARWAAVAALALAVFAYGDVRGRTAVQARWDHEKLAQAEASYQVALEAKQRGDTLSAQLAGDQELIAKLHKEKDDAIARLTTGRAECLRPAAVSLLNRTAAGGLSETASATPAEGPGGTSASDRDAAEWIADARRQYALCAARLNTLIDFHQ